MSIIGAIEQLNLNKTDVESYLERMDHLFRCNKVEESEKVDLFVTLIGGDAYKLLKTMVKPQSVSEKTYAELKKILKDRMAPKGQLL
ncbi:hypothetical protein RI129_011191 [Pyrocoelia pectoralis]|uniref:Uncharacterized protein n=1 Tax=Pyrocoelia pectoralis TaxID=417401 RepID=A0AAN7V0J5_9COLE